MTTRHVFVVGVVSACGVVEVPATSFDARVHDGAVADSTLDAAPAGPFYSSCAQLAATLPGAPSGEYTIDPDGSGGAAPFTALCEMAVRGGGWTQVNTQVAASLAPSVDRAYLYLYGSKGYVSPCTSDAWSWTTGEELTGTYSYFTDDDSGSASCAGSTEKPSWGVGCSSGPGPTTKILPVDSESSAIGASEICQDIPNAFGSACEDAVVFEKEGCTP